MGLGIGGRREYNSDMTSFRIGLVAVAVGVAFADSSIVLLALPELYTHLHTTIVPVSWVVTAYNAAVAVAALALVFFVHRMRAAIVMAIGLVVFMGASIACALANGLWVLVAARSVQGVGAALLLAGSLPLLTALTGSAVRGATVWTLAGTFGAALGPALGGVVTQILGWRAIFAVQAPLASLGLVAIVAVKSAPLLEEGWRPSLAKTGPTNTCIGLLFGALVGVLFLSVLLVITVWGHSPIVGAAIVSVLPLATLAARPLEKRLPPMLAIYGGAALLGLGLVALALLPSASAWFLAGALVVCGIGLGLSIPVLSHAALDLGAGLTRSGTLTIGVRHLGLVLAIALIAPLLAAELPPAGHRAERQAISVLLDAPVGLTSKIPVALDARKEFDRARAGQLPNLARPFDAHGAKHDAKLAAARDALVSTIKNTITRSFRSSFLLSAAFAALALVVAFVFRRRVIEE